ncbi:glycosyltransferase family 2 protein [Erythrobacter sp. YT30]|uniref:glycosyltransferase family 2 protein n=1 Tax=Erythrobacter sp. YT30 TaxID=1735012 RepID=UPI000AA88BD5|nr:glycosyltransferase family 2 protein [Erythrobacter sp. YT30]
MSVLAVIPCLNEAEHLDGLLTQMLGDQTYTKLVVADGGSDDGSLAIIAQHQARDPRLKLLDNPDRIQSAGINRAVAQYGDGMDWLVRIDAHCLYPDNYGAQLIAIAERENADAVVVPMVTRGNEGWQKATAIAQNSALGTGGSAHRHLSKGQWVDHGHHALMRVEAFKQLGGYCEQMPCNEDAEFDVRQTKEGLRIWLDPAPAITYFPRKSLGALARQYFRYGTGRARTVRRHKVRMKLRQLIPVGIFCALCAVPLAFLHPIFAAPAALWALACLAYGVWAGIKAGGGGMAMLSGIPAMIMHASWGAGFTAEWLGNRAGDRPKYGLQDEPGDTRV